MKKEKEKLPKAQSLKNRNKKTMMYGVIALVLLVLANTIFAGITELRVILIVVALIIAAIGLVQKTKSTKHMYK